MNVDQWRTVGAGTVATALVRAVSTIGVVWLVARVAARLATGRAGERHDPAALEREWARWEPVWSRRFRQDMGLGADDD
ncbi:hypothetical protein [Streptomyces xanthii]|uniref:Uncharacterized protein n=1 Tax=Streptomyces xanthii TaxID=2768069 RepID=A0A7H1B0R1_9ACTN|nr:hypothetical protein [Streptomyces xanthii]QNS02316.1 hypothetical protein IAG42_00960 [Streptomyces xanthii]